MDDKDKAEQDSSKNAADNDAEKQNGTEDGGKTDEALKLMAKEPKLKKLFSKCRRQRICQLKRCIVVVF